MRLHSLHHVPFESLGSMAAWAQARGHRLSARGGFETRPYKASLRHTRTEGDFLGTHQALSARRQKLMAETPVMTITAGAKRFQMVALASK